MKKAFLILSCLLLSLNTFGQSSKVTDSLYQPDPHYLEDQLYFGISYIILKNMPENMTQNGFSNTVKFGFIRDLPINERRNFGFGLGLGLSWETYYQNLKLTVDEQTGALISQILTNEAYSSNSFRLNKIDIPFEIRWRGSTPEKYKFWRLYTGITLSYVYTNSANYVTDKIDVTYKNLNIINPWQLGANVSAGYGTWNFTFYYGLSNLVKDNFQLGGQTLKLNNMQFGFVYYFL
jgi:hypothetical protein